MRLRKPDEVSGRVTYEQRYTVSSWGAKEAIDSGLCQDGCSPDCDAEGQCVELAQGTVTDRIIECRADQQ